MDYINLCYQHRVGPEVPIEVVLETLRPLIESGQLATAHVDRPSIETARRAKAVKGVGEKVIAAQMEFSPFELYVEKTGLVDVINENDMGVAYAYPLRGPSHGPTVIYPLTEPKTKQKIQQFPVSRRF